MSSFTLSQQPSLRRSGRKKSRCSLELDVNLIQESRLLSLNESNIHNAEEKNCLTSNDVNLEKNKAKKNNVASWKPSAVSDLNSEVNENKGSVFNENMLNGASNEKSLSSVDHQYNVETKLDIRTKPKCKRKLESSDPISKSFKSSLRGVYFHFLKQEWRAVLGHGSRRQQKTFSVCKYGFDAAKQFAEHLRTQYELSGYVHDTRFTGCHRKSKADKCSKSKKHLGMTLECKNPKVKTVQKSIKIEPLTTFAPISSIPNRKALKKWIRSIPETKGENIETPLKTSTLQCDSNQSSYNSTELDAIRQIIDSGVIEPVNIHDVLVDYLSSPPLRRWEPPQKILIRNNEKCLTYVGSNALVNSGSSESSYEKTVTEELESNAHPMNYSFASNVLKTSKQHLLDSNESSISKPLQSSSKQYETIKQNQSITHSFNELNETVTHLLFST